MPPPRSAPSKPFEVKSEEQTLQVLAGGGDEDRDARPVAARVEHVVAGDRRVADLEGVGAGAALVGDAAAAGARRGSPCPAPLSRISLPVTVRLPFARMPPPSVPAEFSRISESATVSEVPASVEIAPPGPFTAEPAFSSTSWIVAAPPRRSKIRVVKLPLISVWPRGLDAVDDQAAARR